MSSSPDQSIDKVLAALRTADPSPGMELRILAAIENQAAAQSRSALRQEITISRITSQPARRLVALGISLAAALTVALILPSTDRQHRPATHANLDLVRANPDLAHTNPNQARATPPPISPAPAQNAETHPKRSSHPSASSPTERLPDAPQDLDALAVSEMNAPSMPAPPLPLTRQEKLLLRFAHRGDPDQQNILNGDLRAQQLTDQETDFYKFFGKRHKPAPAGAGTETETGTEDNDIATKGQGQ